jgi:hypothetical protein
LVQPTGRRRLVFQSSPNTRQTEGAFGGEALDLRHRGLVGDEGEEERRREPLPVDHLDVDRRQRQR